MCTEVACDKANQHYHTVNGKTNLSLAFLNWLKKTHSILPILCNSGHFENCLPEMTRRVARFIPAYSLGWTSKP